MIPPAPDMPAPKASGYAGFERLLFCGINIPKPKHHDWFKPFYCMLCMREQDIMLIFMDEKILWKFIFGILPKPIRDCYISECRR